MSVDMLLAIVMILVAMAIGDFVSTKTKALVPSVFVTALIFIIGYWTFLPQDVVGLSTWGQPVAGLFMFLLITHMGTLMNLKELASQWKTVVIA